jgi:hypothetical protein
VAIECHLAPVAFYDVFMRVIVDASNVAAVAIIEKVNEMV